MGLLDKIFRINPLAKKVNAYDLDTIAGIRSIPIPQYKPLTGSLSTPVKNIEYILQRKATEHWKAGRYPEALACLRKSNEIMPHSNFLWSKKDYMRLVEYLRKCKAFDEARAEEEKINELFDESLNLVALNMAIQNAKSMKTDLLETTEATIVCAECSSFCRRVFSISGKDKRFPKIPNSLFRNRPGHEYCILDFHPFFYRIEKPIWRYKGNLIQWANRPYRDERNPTQKKDFRERVTEEEQLSLDRDNYNALCELAPNIAPKSFGAYRRMKKTRTANYLKIIEIGLKAGIDIDKKADLSRFQL